jgi:hypothetical protein
MKKEFLKLAGVKSEKEFYKKYPTEEAFFKAHPKAIKELAKGGEAFPQTATMDNFFSYGVPVPPTYYAAGGSFPMAQPENLFFSPVYGNVPNPYNKAMGGASEAYPQSMSFPYGATGRSTHFIMQDGGQQDPQQVLMQIAQALQQGTPPEEVLKYLVDNGVPQDKAVEIIQNVMTQIQGSGQEAATQEQMAAQQPAMEDGGVSEIPDPSRKRIADFTSTVKGMAETANQKRLASIGTGSFKNGGAKKLKRFAGGGPEDVLKKTSDLTQGDSGNTASYSDSGNQVAQQKDYLTKDDLNAALSEYFANQNRGYAPQGDMSMFAPMLAAMFAQNPNALANMFSQAAANGQYMFTGPSNPLYKFTASMDGNKLRGLYGNQHIYEALFPKEMQDAIISGKFSEMMANNPEFRSIADTYGLQGITHKRKGFFPRLFGNKEVLEYDFRVPNEAPTVSISGNPYDLDKNDEYDARELLEREGSVSNPIRLDNITIPYPQSPSSSELPPSQDVPFYLDPNSTGLMDPSDPQLLRDMNTQYNGSGAPYLLPTVGIPTGVVAPPVTQPPVQPPVNIPPTSSYNPPAFNLKYSLKNIVSPLELSTGKTDVVDVTENLDDWKNYQPSSMDPRLYSPDVIEKRWGETLGNPTPSEPYRSNITQGELHESNMKAVENMPDPIKEIAVDTSMNKDLDMRILLMAAAGANTPLGDLSEFNNRGGYYYKEGKGPTSDKIQEVYDSPEVQKLIKQQYDDDPRAFTETILAYRDMMDQRIKQRKNKPGASYSGWHNRNAQLAEAINNRYFSPSTGYVDPYGQPYEPMLDLYTKQQFPNWKKYGGALRKYFPGGPILSPNVPPVNSGQVIEVADPTEPIPTWNSPTTPIADQLSPQAIGYNNLGMDEPITMDLEGEKPNYGYKNLKVKGEKARFVGKDKFYRNQLIKDQATQFLNKPSIQSKYFGMGDPLEQYYASLDTGATPVTRGDFNVLDKNNIPSPYNRNPIRRDFSEAPMAKAGGSIRQNDIMYMDEDMIRDFVAKGGQIEYLD